MATSSDTEVAGYTDGCELTVEQVLLQLDSIPRRIIYNSVNCLKQLAYLSIIQRRQVLSAMSEDQRTDIINAYACVKEERFLSELLANLAVLIGGWKYDVDSEF